jgi:methylenetetrahydrofolate reductase (NADPH)
MSSTNRFAKALANKEFVITCELIPGRGAHEDKQETLITEAQELWETGLVHALSITDNPGGNPALFADAFAHNLFSLGIEPLVHMTCKDRNRNQLQAQLYALERAGISTVLAMSGDAPASGWKGKPRAAFDLDPIHLIQLIHDMNKGLSVQTPRGEEQEYSAHFLPGAVVSPFKWTEGETITQYLKLRKKLVAGAQFIISQLGYDARKMEELIWYVRDAGFDIPLIANIYLVTAPAARFMNRGGIPGAFMPDGLLALLEEEAQAEDKGRVARFERAAQMVAVARGMGYAGVHIGGLGLNATTLTQILTRADELQDTWRELAKGLLHGQNDGFYLYDKDEATGLNKPERAEHTERVRGSKIMRTYGLSRFFHHWVLTKDKRFYGILKSVMDSKERHKGRNRHHGLEHVGKVALYGCMDCGDCGLEATIYTCPMSQCPKSQRNGPCGGSMNGWCEVYPNEKYCIHYKAYHRLKKYHKLYKLDTFITPPNDWDYFETSAWSNYTHDRDNAAKREPLPPPAESDPLL